MKTEEDHLWISVKDALPDDDRKILAGNSKGYNVASFQKSLSWDKKPLFLKYKMKFINIYSKGFEIENVTHWRELPSPPNSRELK